ncbi:hypothetical protein BKK56_02655 [Rodentibacter genomosp. 2]|uniref:hypothetical protein n=1 Tax=Rodentibacter genomosp. 2 TaxID=1908266 RepID=UPI0009842770|nr:hypothetical protein BKK56_02655 [Rodentibacter genomosp. 2]
MKNIKLCLFGFILSFFCKVSWGGYFLKDNILFYSRGDIQANINIEKNSDDDIINIKYNIFNKQVDVYSSSSSNSSYYVSSIKYDHNKKSFIQERIEYVTPCSYCNDLRTEYCSMSTPKDISRVDFSDIDDNTITCYPSYEGKFNGSEFDKLDSLLKAFNSNKQYMKSFSCDDIKNVVGRFPKKDNLDKYKAMISFFKLEGEYSLLSCLSKELKFYKKGVSKNKIYLYDNPRDEYKTKLYLIDGDHFLYWMNFLTWSKNGTLLIIEVKKKSICGSKPIQLI